MTKKSMNVARVATSSALGIALAIGGTSVAFAHGAKDHGRSMGQHSTKSHGHSMDQHSTKSHGHEISGLISAITATTPGTMTLTLSDGTTVTYTTTAATTYFEGRSAATSSALAVGEQVDVALNATTPTTADSVSVDLTKFEGKITAITGVAGAATITLTGPDNTTRTVMVTPTTTLEMDGQTAAFSSLVVGAEIGATGLDAANNTLTATSIRVSAPEVNTDALRAQGTISAVSTSTPGTLTLTLGDGTSVTYTTTAATTYFEGRSAATSSALAVGEQVDVVLNASTPTSVDSVSVDMVNYEGQITAITGVAGAATITLTGPDNTTLTVMVTPTTTLEMDGQTALFSSLVVGAEIEASGLSATNNTLTATSVEVSAPEVSTQDDDSTNQVSDSQDSNSQGSNDQGLSIQSSTFVGEDN